MKKLIKILFLLLIITSFGCSKSSAPAPSGHEVVALEESKDFFDHPEEVTLYDSTIPNANSIKKCAFVHDKTKSCKVFESPLIGVGRNEITINDIINKTMASNPSYIQTFKEVLSRMPSETLQMFGSVNAIVISERINPSFYYVVSGAIYISANYFWKTPEERKKARTKKDERDDYGSTLAFLDNFDYLKDGRSLFQSASSNYRTTGELAPNLIKVLFHELTHAGDYFPKSTYSSNDLNLDKTYYENLLDLWDETKIVSQKLNPPLQSTLLSRIGKILYEGEEAKADDLEVTALEVTKEFNNDAASDLYAYSDQFEDLAMLVESSLMYHYYQYSRLSIFITLPQANYMIPDDFDYPIAGGVKNKIADPKVKDRALYAVENILTKDIADNVDRSLSNITPKEIPEGTSWEKLKTF